MDIKEYEWHADRVTPRILDRVTPRILADRCLPGGGRHAAEVEEEADSYGGGEHQDENTQDESVSVLLAELFAERLFVARGRGVAGLYGFTHGDSEAEEVSRTTAPRWVSCYLPSSGQLTEFYEYSLCS